MSILFVGEKTSLTDHLLSHAPIELRRQPITAINLVPIGSLRFNYPRTTPFSDIPRIMVPSYKIGPMLPMISQYSDGSREKPSHQPEWLRDQQKLSSFFQGFDQLIIGCDPDYAGQFGASQWLNFAGIDFSTDPRITHRLFITDLSKEGIVKAWEGSNTPSPQWTEDMLREAYAKRFFDYNYNINSMVLFGSLLREYDIDTTDFVLTKNQMMLLHIMSQQDQLLSEGRVIEMMWRYPGSGKYSARDGVEPMFGSCASRHDLMEQLVERGLLDKLPQQRGTAIQIANAGTRFLGRLHKKTFDPDLHFRLGIWCKRAYEGDLDGVKEEMSRYLRTVFGKQKRYMSNAGV